MPSVVLFGGAEIVIYENFGPQLNPAIPFYNSIYLIATRWPGALSGYVFGCKHVALFRFYPAQSSQPSLYSISGDIDIRTNGDKR